jgi:RND family efflux transporter MFP subunit
MKLLRTSLLLLPLLSACGADHATPAPDASAPAQPVRVVTVESGPAQAPVHATGVLAPLDEARLAFKVGGIIADVSVRAGDRVSAGQRLATLEAAEVDAAQAQAREAHAKALRDLERGRQLFADAVITREQLDDLGTAEAVARAQLNAAQFNRRYADITAPADGVVLRRLAEPRELVAAGQPVLQVSRGDSGWVLKAGVSDRDFVQLHDGDSAEIRFDAYPDRTFKARVRELGGAADPRTGTFPVELEVEPEGATLASGLIGRVQIRIGGDTTADYIPLSALVEGDAKATTLFLYDADTQRVSEHKVPVRFVTDTHAVLGAALPPGSQVVTTGASYLRDGDAVRIID